MGALKATKVVDLANEPLLQQEVQELYAAISLTFQASSAFKLFENSHDDALIRHVRQMQIQIPAGAQPIIGVEREPQEPVKPE